MKTNDIEKMLSPKCGFKASENLKNRILEQAQEEAVPQTTRTVPWLRWATGMAAAVAIVAVAVIVKPGSTPMYAAEALFHKAAEYFMNSPSFTAEFEVRTKADENFSYIKMSRRFVEHTMTVIPENDFWMLEKEGRKALRSGNYIWQWMPEQEFGWKYDKSEVSVIEGFAYILNPYSLLKSEEAMAEANPNTTIRQIEKDGKIILEVDAPAEAEYAKGDINRNSSILDSDTRREYTFEKSTGKLLTLRITAKTFGIRRTIVKMTDINYSPSIEMNSYAVPENIEWADLTREGLEKAAKSMAIDEFKDITPELAVEKMFAAMKNWDKDILQVVLYGSNTRILEKRYKGCELIETGDSFRSGARAGVFVPCKVKFPDGKTEKLNVCVRNDNYFGVWNFDGGYRKIPLANHPIFANTKHKIEDPLAF